MSEINIYVKAIDTSPHYEFYTDSVGTTELTPTNTLYTNNTYIFNRLNNETSHPFFISDVGYEQESTSAITITTYPISSGSNDYSNGIKNNDLLKLEFNTLTSSDTLYYYCTSHSSMVSTFVLIDPPAAAIFNSYVNVNDNLIVTGNITLDGDISGSGSNLYDIPNSGLVNNSITINSQNVALGESVTLIASQWTTDSNAIYYDGGNVGIQTSDPSYALDVSGSVNCSELLVNGTAPSFGGDGSSYVQLDSTYVTPSETYANPDQNTISLETNNWNLDFLNNIYYNTGNVGIGVDTASFELDVSGSVNCTELLVNGTAPTFGGEYVLYDDTYETSALNYREVSVNISTTSSTTSSGVWDLSDSNTISYTNGNVGIGTTSPSTVLHVQKDGINEVLQTWYSNLGNTAGERNINLISPTSDSADAPFHFQTGNAITFRIDTIEALNIDSGGNVGIGTTSPAYELDVSGDIGINGSLRIGGTQDVSQFMGDTEYSACFENYIYAPAIINYLEIGTAPAGIVFGDNSSNGYDQISLITAGITRAYINGAGKVGIGTTIPAYELDVSGNINIRAPVITSTQGNDQDLGSITFRNNYRIGVSKGTSAAIKCTTKNNSYDDDGSLAFCTGNGASDATVKMIIDDVGYVGIGTTDPAYELDVSGNINCSNLLFNGSSDLVLGGPIGIGGIDKDTYPNSMEKTLNVRGGIKILGSSGIVFERDTGTFQWSHATDNPGGQRRWTIEQDSSILRFRVTQGSSSSNTITDYSHVMNGANVGIYTTSPAYRLDVNGSVGGTSFTTTSDDRLKSNEVPITNALTSLMKLNPMTYDKYDNMDKSGNCVTESGLISQDIWYQVPELRHIVSLGNEYSDVSSSSVSTPIDVSNNELLQDADYNNLGWSTTKPSGVKYTYLIAYLIKAIQELNIQRQEEKDALQASHDSLKNELAELKSLLQEKSVI